MLRTRSLPVVVVALLGMAACKGKGAAAGDQAGKQAAPTPPAPTTPPAPPAYSVAYARQLIAGLRDCPAIAGCAPYQTLVGFGAQAVPDLLATLGDRTGRGAATANVAAALGALKLPELGPKLLALASASQTRPDQLALYSAAGASGGQATFDALIATYGAASATYDDRQLPMRIGLHAFPAECLAWAQAQLATTPEAADRTAVVELVTDNATVAALPLVLAYLAKVKDPNSRHLLAAKAIELGDLTQFKVFVADLQRADAQPANAARRLATVAERAPASLKPRLIKLVTKAQAEDPDSLSKNSFDRALAALEK